MNNSNPHIVLFDGVCNLCNGAVQFIIKRDRQAKFRFASLQSEAGQALLRKFSLPTDDFHSFILVAGDKYYSRSSGALRVLCELGGVYKLAYGFIIIPKPIRDFFYDMVARSRYRIFGKRESCMVPTPELRSRFLD